MPVVQQIASIGCAALVLALPSRPAAAAEPAWSRAIEEVSRGDRELYDGHRREARALFLDAASRGDPAAETMARLRLLGLSGNLGGAWHGPRIDRALAQATGPWAAIARADFQLFAPSFTGARPERAAAEAASVVDVLPGPAAARMWLATGDPDWLRRLSRAPRLDGLGAALLEHDGRLPAGPGTWFLGLGLSGAPGIGFGGQLHFVDPDLAWRGWLLAASAGGSSRGGASAALALRSPGRLGLRLDGGAARSVGELWLDDVPVTYELLGWWAGAGAALRLGPWRAFADLRLRSDRETRPSAGEPLAGHGPAAGLAWDTRRGAGASRRGALLSLSADASLADYRHAGILADARAFAGAFGGVLAGRATWHRELAEGAPWFVLPSAGGSVLSRGAPDGRWRAPGIATADLEQRWMAWGPVELAIFADAALVEDAGLHAGGGAGIRLVLPPEALDVVRLDLAGGDAGWGLFGGWGEAF